MEKLDIVDSLETSELVLGAAICAQLKSCGVITKKVGANNKATKLALFNGGIPSTTLLSPFDNSGKALKKEFREEDYVWPVYQLHGEEFTQLQLFTAMKLSLGRGYCTDAQWALLTMDADKTATKADEVTRSEVTHAVTDKMKALRRSVKHLEDEAAIDKLHEDAQLLEDAAAIEEDRTRVILDRADFVPKKEANDKKAPRDAANDGVVSAIRALTKEVEPKYDNAGAIANLRAALVCLNLPDPTLDPNDPKNA